MSSKTHNATLISLSVDQLRSVKTAAMDRASMCFGTRERYHRTLAEACDAWICAEEWWPSSAPLANVDTEQAEQRYALEQSDSWVRIASDLGRKLDTIRKR